MLRKLVVLGIVGFVLVSAVKGRLSTYVNEVRQEVKSIRESFRDRDDTPRLPDAKDISRLRNEINLLDRDVMAVINQLAKERVEVKDLREKADDLRARQARDRDLLQARAGVVKAGTEPVAFGDRTMTVAEAKAELADGVRRFEANEKSLAGLDAALASRERVKAGLEKQLEALKNQKAELSATVDALEAELTALKLQQMESKFQTDETRLARIKENLRGLKTRIEVEREKLKLLPGALEPAAVKAAAGKSVDDIMAPLAAPAKPKAPVIE